MNKICTTIEQSKKLVKILPIDSADAFYDMAEPEKRQVPIIGHPDEYYDMKDWAIHCWSLAALLDILDNRAYSIDEDANVTLSSYKNVKWDLSISNSSLGVVTKSDSIDACVEMILKLHEKKLI